MESLKDFLEKELNNLERGFIATPASMDNLEQFAKANHGSSDLLLMQMAVQFGYKIAMENTREFVESLQ